MVSETTQMNSDEPLNKLFSKKAGKIKVGHFNKNVTIQKL